MPRPGAPSRRRPGALLGVDAPRLQYLRDPRMTPQTRRCPSRGLAAKGIVGSREGGLGPNVRITSPPTQTSTRWNLINARPPGRAVGPPDLVTDRRSLRGS